jgi:hypothetical protein
MEKLLCAGGFMSQTTFPSLCNDAQVATHSGSIEMPAALESAARCIPLCGLVQGRLSRDRDSRHTFALNYLRQNPGKLVDLASLLRHESLDTTAIYTRPSKEELAADLERSRFNVY